MTSVNELRLDTLARLSAAFPFKFTNADDAVNGALDELLQLRQLHSVSALVPSAVPQAATRQRRGSLYEFIEDGDFQVNDELRWDRPRLQQAHLAHVDADGYIVTEDGQAHEFPTNAVEHLAPGQRPRPWESWVHTPSGKSLSSWREEYRRRKQSRLGSSPEDEQSTDWTETVAVVLKRLPRGAWTTYGDLSRLTGCHPKEIGSYLARAHELTNAWRVLLAEGKVSPSFAWSGEDRGDPHAYLRKEGVRISRGLVADPSQRIHVEGLRRLLAQP